MANKRVNDDGSMKAVIYARYSSENQREESIEGQIRDCYAFAKKNNISVVAEYIDRAYSAKTDRRPDFQRMIKDSARKNFNLVLVWKLDRFARNRHDSAHYKAALKRNGVKVMSVTESISEGSDGILLESVLEGMAEYYSAELSEKVLRGHHENALKCRYNGGTLPIGFSIDKDKNYHVDPITSPYIVEAFTMYDEGRTMKEIVAVLNQHGLKNQRGGELNLNSVSRLLQNRFYIGEYKYREVLVPDGIPAIIPKDLFDRVQEKLAKNKKAPARHKAEDDYLLTTKLFCGDCQSLMFGESGTSQSGATYHYYKCSSAKKKTGCNRKPVKKKWIEDAVLDQVKTVLHDDVFIGDVVHKYLEYQKQENTVIPYLEKNLSDTQRSIDNLIAAIEQGIITPSTKQRLKTLEVTKRELEDKILIENMKRPLRTEDELWAWFRYMRNFDLTRLEERRQLIDVFVNTVFLYSDRFLLTLNFGYGSKTVLFTDIPCSDKVACGRPKIAVLTAKIQNRKGLLAVFIMQRRIRMGLFGPSKKERMLQAEIDRLKSMLLPEQQEIEVLNQQIANLKSTISNLESTITNNNNKIAQQNATMNSIDQEIAEKRKQLAIFEVDINSLDYGLYKPTFEFANSDLYKEELSKLRDNQKQFVKNDNAAFGDTNWQVNGSAAQGRTMVNNYKKLLLRAFNVECDDIVANVRVSNLDRSIERIEKISEQISKLGKTMGIGISPAYVRLKIEEVHLALDFQQKKQAEKELLKELRAQEREEAKVQKEIEEERKRLKKEQTHYENALKTVLSQIEKNGETEELLAKKSQLESQIDDTTKAIQDVDYREANRKAGYVYIISNIGAFGENVYKIGMTRRLDPNERIYELSDASVPFNFDVHAMIFTEDAPALETALHNAFQDKKLNKINARREFFAVSLDEIKSEVRKNFDKTVEWIDVPEAEQYRQSLLLIK